MSKKCNGISNLFMPTGYKMYMSVEDIEKIFNKYAELPRIEIIYPWYRSKKLKDVNMHYAITYFEADKAAEIIISRILTTDNMRKEAERFASEIFDAACSLTECMYTECDIGYNIDAIYYYLDKYFAKVARKVEQMKKEENNENH